MDHAEVRAWLDEAFFRPGALRRLEEGLASESAPDDPAAAAVQEHLRACPACAHELRALRATGLALDVGVGPPPAASERMLAKVRQLGRARPAGARPPATLADAPAPSSPRRAWAPLVGRRRPALLGWAAALLVILVAFGSGALLGLSWPVADEPAGPRLQHAATVMGELLSEPDARQIQLVDTSNAPAGLVVHSIARQQLAVLSGVLEEPAEGRYECYLERDGERTLIGPMHFDGGTAFWAGPVGGPSDAGRSGDRFVVMLEEGDEVELWGQF